MLRFRYTGNHKEDEAYMQQMCAAGWAAVRLVEGFWTFEPCKAGCYTYRVAYLRGKKTEEIAQFKAECAEKGIEFVSRYSFWAIFRSEHPFEFYTGTEEISVCRQIYRPMPIGAVLSLLALILCVFLTIRSSRWFLIPDVLVMIYGFVCARCGFPIMRCCGSWSRAKEEIKYPMCNNRR